MAPSQRSIFLPFPVNRKMNNKIPTKIFTRTSNMEFSFNSTGAITVETPRIKNILKMFDPTTFPIAMSTFFLRTATMEVASSGREVPMETTVKPITLSERPMASAISTALVTINLPPSTSPPNQRIRNRMAIPTVYLCVSTLSFPISVLEIDKL